MIYFTITVTISILLSTFPYSYFAPRKRVSNFYISSDFDRASSLLCGNKVPTRCNR